MRRSTIALGLLTLAACKTSIPLTPEPPPGLDAEVEQLASTSAPGSVRVGELFRGSSPTQGQGQRFSVVLNKGQCYHLAGVGDGNIRALSLYLWDPDDSRAETERGPSNKTVLNHCPDKSGMHAFEVKPTSGNGHFALGVYSQDAPPADPEPAPAPVPAGPDLAKIIEDEANASAPGAERVGEFFKDSSDKRDWFTALEAGQCYWWIGAGDPATINELTLYLWDPQDTRITQSKSQSNKVTIGHCPTKSGMFKFQAAVSSGDGNYMVGLYKKTK
jgi:hypothetical protein